MLLLFLDYKYLRWLSEIIFYHLNSTYIRKHFHIVFIIQTPTLMVRFKKLNGKSSMWFVGWEASLDELSHLMFRSMEQTSLWHFDSSMQITKLYTCNMQFPFWYYSSVLLLYRMIIKALQHTKLQMGPSLYLQSKPNQTRCISSMHNSCY